MASETTSAHASREACAVGACHTMSKRRYVRSNFLGTFTRTQLDDPLDAVRMLLDDEHFGAWSGTQGEVLQNATVEDGLVGAHVVGA